MSYIPLYRTKSATEKFSNICNDEKIGSDGDLLSRKKCINIYKRMDTIYPGMSPRTFIMFFATVFGYSGFMCEVVEKWITTDYEENYE